jgi:hypothetical protein
VLSGRPNVITELVVAYTEVYCCPSKVTVVVIGTWYETSSPPQVSMVVTVGVSPAGVGEAAAAMAAAWFVFTHVA